MKFKSRLDWLMGIWEEDPTKKLSTPLHPRIERFYKRHGRKYQPKYAEDEPTTRYKEVTD